MNARLVNIAILLLLVFELTTGFGSFLTGEPGGRWLFWFHRAGGLALVVLLAWKLGMVVRSYHRRGLGISTGLSAVQGVLFLASLGTGLLWATVGLPRILVPGLGSWTGLNLHVALSVLLIPLFVLHTYLRWPRPSRADLVGRRAVLRLLGLLAVGFVFWRAQEVLSVLVALSGSSRRFTGSREEGSFAGNRHPVTNWLSDRVQRIDPDRWRLQIYGEAEREPTFSYEEVLALGGTVRQVVLDCTGGWYTVQRWSGVPVAVLLEQVELKDEARSLVFYSATGYSRRFPLDEVDNLLLATHVEDEVLSAGHGFPLRLVAPGYRGYSWVKWVTELEVSRDPGWLQPPLPLQ
ncbi:MAG: molybdopterin-dependent oxidoreductase [Actinomycetota bacterium]|nr:molybdopterin-dependent oxidoreductase [Actinomycetota bacterium]